MSRYIDADAIKEALKQNLPRYVWSVMLSTINVQPHIDIVRCKECRWLDKGENESCSWSMCTRHIGQYINVNADDFCSYGERREP